VSAPPSCPGFVEPVAALQEADQVQEARQDDRVVPTPQAVELGPMRQRGTTWKVVAKNSEMDEEKEGSVERRRSVPGLGAEQGPRGGRWGTLGAWPRSPDTNVRFITLVCGMENPSTNATCRDAKPTD
jgi:hypothetical protein